MAFVSFDMASSQCAIHGEPIAAAPARPFSALELRIIALARQEPPASAREPGRMRKLLAALFGLPLPNPLADPELERLRRAAILAWRDATDPRPTLSADRQTGSAPPP